MKQSAINKNFYATCRQKRDMIAKAIIDSDILFEDDVFDHYRLTDLDAYNLTNLDNYKLRESIGGVK